MNLRTVRGFQKIITAGLILFLVQLACGGLAPTDPRIPESLNNMVVQFDPFLIGIQAIPTGVLQPPLITKIEPGSISGLGSFEFPPKKIRVYLLELQGCEQEPLRKKLLGETSTDTGLWTILYNLKPGQVVGATQDYEGKESGLSNLMVIDQDQAFISENIEQLQQTNSFPLGSIGLLGSGIPGACVVLQNQDIQYGRESSVTVGTKNKWKVEIPIREGENRFRVFVMGWDNIGYDLSLRGSIPNMQWPYTDIDKNADGSCHYNDTKDKQEPRVDNCYHKFAISTWYGRNDFYVKSNRAGGFHNGLDIAGTSGSAVRAVAKGEVFYIQISNVEGTGGNMVLIDHGSWVSAYIHLSKVTIKGFISPTKSELVNPPRVVEAGEQIGETGNSGCSGCGAHLHFSAFRWTNGYREASLKEGNIPQIPWLADNAVFKLLNVNPPAGETLGSNLSSQTGEIVGSGENSFDRLADRRNTDKPEEYYSNFDYWQVNWNEIRINEYGCASGTKFDELTWGIVDETTKKEGWICK